MIHGANQDGWRLSTPWRYTEESCVAGMLFRSLGFSSPLPSWFTNTAMTYALARSHLQNGCPWAHDPVLSSARTSMARIASNWQTEEPTPQRHPFSALRIGAFAILYGWETRVFPQKASRGSPVFPRAAAFPPPSNQHLHGLKRRKRRVLAGTELCNKSPELIRREKTWWAVIERKRY